MSPRSVPSQAAGSGGGFAGTWQQSLFLFQNVPSDEKSRLQLLLPHTRPLAHSLSLLQSPSPSLHGPKFLQHFLMFPGFVPSQSVDAGGFSVGFSVGGFSVGGFSVGGFSVGVFSVGGFSVGGFSVGGFSVGGFSVGPGGFVGLVLSQVKQNSLLYV